MANDLKVSLRIQYDQATGRATVRGIESVEDAIDDLDRAGERTEDLGDGIEDAGRKAERAEPAVMGLGRALIALGVATATREMFQAGAAAEQLRTRLEFAEGSVEAGAARMDELRQTARDLGLGLDETVAQFIRLKDLGLDPSRAALEAYANVAAAKGTSITQFVEAVADATVGEFERLKEFGIKAAVEGDRVVLRFRGQRVEIANDARSIEEALIRIGQVEYAGAVAAQADTASAKIDLLAQSLGRLGGQLAEGSGAVEGAGKLAQALTEISDAIDDSARSAEEGARGIPILEQVYANLAAVLGGAQLAKEIEQQGLVLSILGRIAAAIRGDVEALTDADRELAEATERVARGALTAEEAMGALTEQQMMLLQQTGEFGEVAWDAAESTERMAAATDGLAASAEAAARALGTTIESLKSGLSAQDLGIIKAFDELRTRADLEGEEIGRAFALALARTSAQGLPALQQSWEQAREEGQISIEEYSDGLDAVIKAQDRLATKTAGSVEDAARRMKDSWKEAFSELEDEVDNVTSGMDVLIARQEIIAQRGAALGQALRGEISAAELGQRMLELDRQRAEIDERRREAKFGQVDAEQRISDISSAREPTARELLRIALEEERAAQGTASAVDAAYRVRVLEAQLEREQSASRGTASDDGIRRVSVETPTTGQGGIQSAARVEQAAVDMAAVVSEAVAAALEKRLSAGFVAPVKAQITVDTGALGSADFARESLKRGVRYT